MILTAADGILRPAFADALRISGVRAEVISHPLLAMASLCWQEFNGRKPGERTGLFIVDCLYEDMTTMINAIQLRLPHVSIWMVQSDVTLNLAQGRPRAASTDSADDSSGGELPAELEHGGRSADASTRFNPIPSRRGPSLQIRRTDEPVNPSASLDFDVEGPQEPQDHPPAPSGTRLTSAEVEALFGDDPEFGDDPSHGPPAGGDGPRGRGAR